MAITSSKLPPKVTRHNPTDSATTSSSVEVPRDYHDPNDNRVDDSDIIEGSRDSVSGASPSGGYNPIQQMVIQSEIYQRVFNIFSRLSDPYWLNQLQSIIDSLSNPNSTFWDQLGLSTSYEDKKDAIFSSAISQISQLYASYQQYINSLPTTQVQQLLNAGSNPIVNGGLSTSSLDTEISPNAGEQIQRDVTGEFTSFVGSMLDLTSGIFGVAQSIQNIFQSHSLFPTAKSLANLGLKSAELGLKSQEIGLQSDRAELAKKGVFMPLAGDENLDDDSSINLSNMHFTAGDNLLADMWDAGTRQNISASKHSTVTEDEFQEMLYDIAQLEILNKLSGLTLQEQRNQFDLQVLGLTDPNLTADAVNEANIEKSSTSIYNRIRNGVLSGLIDKYSKKKSILGNYFLINLVQNSPIDYRANIAETLLESIQSDGSNPFDLLKKLVYGD